MAWKPNRKRLSDQVADRIKAQIFSGAYAAGSRLPPEREFAEEMGVTRLTLREALKIIEQAGFIQIRHGDGTFVCDWSKEVTLRLLTEILDAGQDLSQPEVMSLLEFRRVNFLGFAGIVIDNAGANHLDQLRVIVDQEKGLTDNVDEMVRLDYAFHEQLAEASGNLVFTMFMRSVKTAYVYLCHIVFQKVYDNVGNLESVAWAHQGMFDAIAARDLGSFRDQMANFVECGNLIVQEHFGGRAGEPHDCCSPADVAGTRK